MNDQLRRFVWTWQCARVFRKKASLPRSVAWDFATSCYDQYAPEGYSPADAAWEEMSYWND